MRHPDGAAGAADAAGQPPSIALRALEGTDLDQLIVNAHHIVCEMGREIAGSAQRRIWARQHGDRCGWFEDDGPLLAVHRLDHRPFHPGRQAAIRSCADAQLVVPTDAAADIVDLEHHVLRRDLVAEVAQIVFAAWEDGAVDVHVTVFAWPEIVGSPGLGEQIDLFGVHALSERQGRAQLGDILAFQDELAAIGEPLLPVPKRRTCPVQGPLSGDQWMRKPFVDPNVQERLIFVRIVNGRVQRESAQVAGGDRMAELSPAELD